MHDDDAYTAVSIESIKGVRSLFILANKDAAKSKQHKLKVKGKEFSWTGPYLYTGS